MTARRVVTSLLLFSASTALWLPCLQLVFRPPARDELVEGLARRQRSLALADTSAERALLRRINPEWDLMSRTFGVLAFTNLALSQPQRRAEHLEVADTLITQTLRDETNGHLFFLLPYGRRQPFHDERQRSLFVDGEMALMLAARQAVEPRADFVEPLRTRIDEVTRQLETAPHHLAESYPDEGWTFCNSIALAALRMSDGVDGRSHEPTIARWLVSARQLLVEPRSGLLRSSFRHDGSPLDGPEGSTVWLAAHMLQLVDEDFAKDQYQRARRELGHVAFGFGWASEWPASLRNVDDVDSGPTVPLVEANAGSSGLALVGAAAFDDDGFLDGLVTSLQFAAFPVEDETGLRFSAGNSLADAVLLYALTEGPLWQRARRATLVSEAR
jgi:hypothetical protein